MDFAPPRDRVTADMSWSGQEVSQDFANLLKKKPTGDHGAKNSTVLDAGDLKSYDPGLQTQERFEYDTMSTFIRESLSGDLSHIPQAVRDGKGTGFIPANFPKRFPHDLHVEEAKNIVPSRYQTTSKMRDPPPPKDMRVKSGYTGHVPNVRCFLPPPPTKHLNMVMQSLRLAVSVCRLIYVPSQGRDYIGGSYKAHDNRGTASKHTVPVIHANRAGNYPIPTKPVVPRPEARMLYHDPFNAKAAGDHQHEYGFPTTAPVPIRIEKVLSGDASDITDEMNATLMADETDTKQLHGGQRDMGGLGTWVMAGYTGHVPKGREVYGTSYYGPPEGPSYHGPFYASDAYAQPGAPNKESICP